MASDDDDSVRLPADPAFLTPPSRVVTIGSFRGIPALVQNRPKVARKQPKQVAEPAAAPRVTLNPNNCQPSNCRCRITAGYDSSSDEESGNYYFRLNILPFLFTDSSRLE